MRLALVLGGGGITGISWELGLLKGLADGGVDVTGADTVVGTSAGSVVGAQITSGRDIDELYAEQLRPADAEIGARFGLRTMIQLGLLNLLPGNARAKRARIGRAATRAHPESAEERVQMIASGIGVHEWPERDLRITAVDAESGVLKVFDRDGGAEIVRAVAASCAVPLVWPPVPVDGRRYVDGGMRSTANVDLAAGADGVVVLAPLPQSFSKHHSIEAQLRRVGAEVRSAVLTPDKAALAAIGKNVLDPAKRADAARAGLDQAASVLDRVRAAWTG